jgi:hypothetical protein
MKLLNNSNKLLVILALLFYYSGYSQLVNIESQRIQTDSIRFVINGDLSYSSQKNNNEKFSVFGASFTSQIKTKSLKDIFLLMLSADYSKVNDYELSNSLLMHYRYNRKLSNCIKLEAFVQYQNNKLLGLDYRELIGIGPRIKITGKRNLKLYYGLLYMYENEKTFNENYIICNSSLNRISTYLSGSVKIAKDIGEFNTVTYYQPCLNDFNNYRLNNQSSLIFTLTPHVKLTNTLTILYDESPPIGISKSNTSFTNGIKISY